MRKIDLTNGDVIKEYLREKKREYKIKKKGNKK